MKQSRVLASNRAKKHVSWEKIGVGAATCIVWGLLTFFLFFLQIRNQGGDSAFVAQVLYNFKHTLRMQTTYYTSTTESIDHVWYKPAAEVCAIDLESKFKDTPWGHHYLIAYLLIPLARMMDVPFMIAFLQAGIYTSVLVFTYLLARQKHLKIPVALLFTGLVMQHPLWYQGLVGQFYFNRFFLPFCGLMILFLERKKINYILVLLAAILAASTNEIYGITIFMVLLCYLWIHKTFDRKLIIFALSFLGFGFVSTAYIQQQFPLRSTQTSSLGYLFGYGIRGFITSVLANVVHIKTQIFALINVIGMGVFSFFHLWLIPPLIFLLLPNILVNVGGAEKIGWATHYHIGYFIPLIWISVLGLSEINNKPRMQIVFIVVSIVFMMVVDPFTLSFNKKPEIVVKTLARSIQYHAQRRSIDLDFRTRLRETVGEGTTLSVPEAISYNLYDHQMYYYPMGIDTVDAVLLKYDEKKTGDRRFYSINYGHQDPNLDPCIFERMKKGGFDFENPTVVDDWAIIRRQVAQ